MEKGMGKGMGKGFNVLNFGNMDNYVKVLACKNFLQRGYTGNILLTEIQRFCDYAGEKNKSGDKIKFIESYLQKVWRISTAPNKTPTQGEFIERFAALIKCDDVDLICKIEAVQLESEYLVLFMENGATSLDIEQIDNLAYSQKETLKDNGIRRIEYKYFPTTKKESIETLKEKTEEYKSELEKLRIPCAVYKEITKGKEFTETPTTTQEHTPRYLYYLDLRKAEFPKLEKCFERDIKIFDEYIWARACYEYEIQMLQRNGIQL